MSYHTAKFGCHSYSGSGVIMILVCLVILQDHVIKESYCFMGGTPLMVSHHPAKFGSYSPCGSGDIMFSVAEEKKNFRCSRFNTPLLLLPLHGKSYE